MNLRKPNSGLTLIELMISMSVLAIASVGALSAFLQTRRMTEDSIYLNTATAVAQGYIEQIKNMEFASLDISPLPTLVNQGVSDPLTVSPTAADKEVGNSATDVVNQRLIDINNTPATSTDDMPMEFVVYVENLTNPTNKVGDCRGITIRYKYSYTDSIRTHNYENTIFTIRSEVQTF